jgi:hypothetical protein
MWLAFLSSVPIYLAVGFLVRAQGGGAAPGLPPFLPSVLLAAGVAVAVLGFVLRGAVARSTSYANYLVVRWALGEAPGLLALVLLILGFPWTAPAILFAVSLIALLLLRPTAALEGEYGNLRGEGTIIG